jgi:hypothetical protein
MDDSGVVLVAVLVGLGPDLPLALAGRRVMGGVEVEESECGGRNEATGEEVVAKVVIEVGGVYQASDGTGEERSEIGWVR